MSDFDFGPDLREGNDHGDSAVLRHCLDLNPEGWALEFGVGSGKSLAVIADVMPAIGFDSFEGLPEDWREGFGKGMFAQSKIPQLEGATVVVGLFEDTLPDFDWPDAPIGLIHIDCDLYSSTTVALAYAGHLMKPGTIVVFDEYFGWEGWDLGGENKAWVEFVTSRNIEAEVIGHGREQLAFRITSVGMS